MEGVWIDGSVMEGTWMEGLWMDDKKDRMYEGGGYMDGWEENVGFMGVNL